MCFESQIKSFELNKITHRYKTLCSSIDVTITQGDDVSPSAVKFLRRLHDLVSRQGEPRGLTDLLSHVLSSTATQKVKSNRKKKGSQSNAQTRRQSKAVPLLVYQIEQLEYSYLRLQKSSKKAIDFSEFMRRSQCRDFRIQIAALNKDVEEEEEEEEEEEGEEEEEEDDEEEEEDDEEEEEDSQETEASTDDRKRDRRSALGDRSNDSGVPATQRNVKRRRKIVNDEDELSQAL